MYEHYGRTLGIYTLLVTSPCIFGRERVGSLGEQIETEEVGSAGGESVAKSKFHLERFQ